jgi:hypothetical protein
MGSQMVNIIFLFNLQLSDQSQSPLSFENVVQPEELPVIQLVINFKLVHHEWLQILLAMHCFGGIVAA